RQLPIASRHSQGKQHAQNTLQKKGARPVRFSLIPKLTTKGDECGTSSGTSYHLESAAVCQRKLNNEDGARLNYSDWSELPSRARGKCVRHSSFCINCNGLENFVHVCGRPLSAYRLRCSRERIVWRLP